MSAREAPRPEKGSSGENQTSVKKPGEWTIWRSVSSRDFADGGPCVPEGMARGFQEMEAVGYEDTKGNAQRLEGRRGVGAPSIRHGQRQKA